MTSAMQHGTVSLATKMAYTGHTDTTTTSTIKHPTHRISTTHASLPLNVHPELADYRYAFNCLICFEQFIEPVELDCQHTFCASCIQAYGAVFHDGSDAFAAGCDGLRTWCPICQRPTRAHSTNDGCASLTTSGTMTPKALAENRSSLIRKVFEQTLKCDCCIATLTAGVLLQSGLAAAALVGATSFDALSATDNHTSTGALQQQKNGIAKASHTVPSNGEVTSSSAVFDGFSKVSGDAGQQGRGRRISPCTPLAEDADFHCSKCELNLCKSCRARHDAQPLFRGHAVVNLTNREAVQLYCQIHTTVGTGRLRTCLFYCSDCDRLECVVCVLHDDPQHRVIKLRDALSERRDALKTLLNSLGPRLDRLDAQIVKLKKMYAERRQNRSTSVGGGPSVPPSFEAATETELIQSRTSTFSIGGQFKLHRRFGSSRRRKPTTDSTGFSGTQQMPSRSETAPDDEDGGSAGTTDSDAASMNADDDASRRGSLHSDEGCCASGTPTGEDEMDRPSATFTVTKGYLGRLKKLFDKSTKVLEISDSKKLLAIYNDLSARLGTVINIELPLLQNVIDGRMAVETTHRHPTTGNGSPIDGETFHPGSLTIPRLKIGHSSSSGGSPDAASPIKSQPLHQSNSDSNNNSNHVNRMRKISSVSKALEHLTATPTQHLAAIVARSTGGSGSEGNEQFRSRTNSLHIPKSLLVRPKLLWKVEKQRTDVGEVCNPSDVAFLPDETALVVAEYDSVNERNNRLQLFDRLTGRMIGTIGQGQMQPLGVAVTRDGQHLAVTDCRGKRVRLLSLPTGQTVVDIGKGQFGWPYGIAVTSHGQLVVTDAFNDTVSVFSPDGKKLKTIGGPGSSSGTTFRNPYHVTVDDRDIVLVSDFGNNSVKAFDLAGRLVYSACESSQRGASELFTSAGGPLTAAAAASAAGASKHQAAVSGKRRRLKGPRGITVEHRQRHVIVADDRSRVCLLSPSGQYVRNLLTEEDSVKYPEAIDCSRSGLLAVTEWNQNNAFAIKLFNLYE